MKLTKEEEQLILSIRKKDDDKSPKKVGYAKENLYVIPDEFEIDEWLFSTSEKKESTY